MKHYTATEIKELNSFSIMGDPNTNICTMTLYNWDDDTEMETDSVFIELTQKDIRAMVRCLEAYLKPEVEE